MSWQFTRLSKLPYQLKRTNSRGYIDNFEYLSDKRNRKEFVATLKQNVPTNSPEFALIYHVPVFLETKN